MTITSNMFLRYVFINRLKRLVQFSGANQYVFPTGQAVALGATGVMSVSNRELTGLRFKLQKQNGWILRIFIFHTLFQNTVFHVGKNIKSFILLIMT